MSEKKETKSAILSSLTANPSGLRIVAIGDKKRYEANKLLLGNNCRFENDEKKIEYENIDVIVICGEYMLVHKSLSHVYIHICDVINKKAESHWDLNNYCIKKDLNIHSSNPYIVEYNRKYINTNIMNVIKHHYMKNKKCKLRILSVGCGVGYFERSLLNHKHMFSEIRGCDISSISIKNAREEAGKIDVDGIVDYFIHDSNNEDFKGERYDIIVANNCVHHVERLEFFYENIKKALDKNGVFIQSEYVCKPRFQHPRILIMTINFLLCFILRKEYKKVPTQRYKRPHLHDMIAGDASEAVRSDEIIPMTKKYFPYTLVRRMPYMLMHRFYQCVNTDFFHTNEKRTLKWCFLIFAIEKLLIFFKLYGGGYAYLVSAFENVKTYKPFMFKKVSALDFWNGLRQACSKGTS